MAPRPPMRRTFVHHPKLEPSLDDSQPNGSGLSSNEVLNQQQPNGPDVHLLHLTNDRANAISWSRDLLLSTTRSNLALGVDLMDHFEFATTPPQVSNDLGPIYGAQHRGIFEGIHLELQPQGLHSQSTHFFLPRERCRTVDECVDA